MHQRATHALDGTAAVVRGWMDAIGDYLAENGLTLDMVQGAGLAMPGPFQRYGVMDRTPNLPAEFAGWDVHADFSRALAEAAGHPVPVVVGNDGNFAVRRPRPNVFCGNGHGTVLMLAAGSGLGCAFIDHHGLPLEGDSLAGMEASHMPAPLHLLNVKPFPCGCGRTWGCVEVYTSLSGLPHLLADKLAHYPDHPLAKSSATLKEKALALRGLAQQGDPLAQELFDFQARALGLHVASLAMALDPQFVVIGGGLMDPEATTPEFRARYLRIISETANPFLWPAQRTGLSIVPAALGDLSQAIGAALMAFYQKRA